jgi:endogenous inhibitor of DNA gyrase (YacG/DUF329 family)
VQPLTVRCPRCGTLYRRPASARRRESASFRCARCRHVFDTEAAEPAMVAGGAEEAEDDDTRFSFDDEGDEAAGPDDDEAVTEAEADAGAAPPRAREAAPERRVVTPARFALRALFTVTLAYAVLSIYLYTHPEAAAEALARLPLLGPMLAETRLNPASIRLTNLRGEYQRVKGDRLVFVVSGTATNLAPVAARGIQIEGRIVGSTEQRQIVFCGAAPRDVRDLSLREIALLQSLEPPRDWTLEPGAETPFLVVFAGPPTDLTAFGADVVAVQAPGRRATAAAAARTSSAPPGG